MTIERHENRSQICCDACPASTPNSYADEDFAVMIADAKAAGWIIRPARPAERAKDTADLFGTPARVAGNERKPDRFTHTCPACARLAGETLL